MKNILFIMFLSMSLMVQAQQGKGQHKQGDYTPEQQAVLKTKRMALHLDLNQDQQDKLLKINRSWAEKRAEQREKFKAQKDSADKPDADLRYAHQSQMLDNQLAYHNEVKKILNEEQYAIWKEHRAKNKERGHGQRRHAHHGKKDQDKS